MKYIYTFLLVIVITFSFLRAQVPNSGFEDWTAGEPNFWTTNNSDPDITITQSNSSHSGSFALKGECIPFVPPFLPVLGPVALCAGADDQGFPIEFRYNSLKGFYKFNSQNGDQIFVALEVTNGTQTIGVGSIALNSASSYTQFAVPIVYVDPTTPNKCILSIQILNPVSGVSISVGSEMYIDDLELSMDVVSDVNNEFKPVTFSLEQNYPNPFNPSTKIRYSIPNVTLSDVEGSSVQLKVFDVLGNEVATLVNEEKPAGNYEVDFNASQLSSGIYLYKLTTGNFIQTRKMILIK
jgi:hypothetical protein